MTELDDETKRIMKEIKTLCDERTRLQKQIRENNMCIRLISDSVNLDMDEVRRLGLRIAKLTESL